MNRDKKITIHDKYITNHDFFLRYEWPDHQTAPVQEETSLNFNRHRTGAGNGAHHDSFKASGLY